MNKKTKKEEEEEEEMAKICSRKLLYLMDMFITLIVVMLSQVHVQVQTL
jgi:hypothetical protein